ncbi:MAG: MFS transporter, partial [Acetobacteraceae bacterium]|nr:MFS transporter [Acetobacteraceae bacterium]
IVYAALLVFCGRLAERFPRNYSFLAGIAVFTVASAACALAKSVETLVAFRLVQAAGAALLTPTSLGLILATFPPERRGGAVRVWAAVGGFAAALGPLAGGLLVTASWRWIFLINVPIGLLALVIGWVKLPRIPGHDVPAPHVSAAALITIGIALLTFGIVKLNDWGWNSYGVALSFAAAAAMLALFVAHCLRSENPFVDPALFRIRDFAGACLAMVPFSVAFGGFLLALVLWEQGVWHWSAMKIGLAIAPGPFMVPLTSLLLAGRLIARFGAAAVAATGLFIFAADVIMWAEMAGSHADPGLAMLCMVPSGIGVGLTLPTLMGVGTSALPASSFATGSGAINMLRQLGLAIGVAILVAIVGSPDLPEAYMAAFRVAWRAMAAITVLGMFPLLLLRDRTQARPITGHVGVSTDSIPKPAFSEPAES